MNISLNLDLEKPTLGGLLTLLVEANMVMGKESTEDLNLHVFGNNLDLNWLNRMQDQILDNYAHTVNIILKQPPNLCYPFDRYTKNGFSYYNTERIQDLYSKLKIKPILLWREGLQQSVFQKSKTLSPKIITIHLKRVFPFDVNESNAQAEVWAKALRYFLDFSTELDVILVGNDPTPAEIELGPRIRRADDIGLNLGEQMNLIQNSVGFIGTASGICSGAVFSEVPYFIYKSPEHHKEQFATELKNEEIFSFSALNQKIIRRIPETKTLFENMRSFL